jgi:hypothetical protein
MVKTCNVYECLRKFKEDENDAISDFCGIRNSEKEKDCIHNSKDCPYFVDKFWDYELKKIITKHEDVYWIADKKDKRDNEFFHGLITGLSREGHEAQEKREEWENEHIDCNKIVCPYCDYEFEYGDNDYPYEEGEGKKKCPICKKTFNCITMSLILGLQAN